MNSTPRTVPLEEHRDASREAEEAVPDATAVVPSAARRGWRQRARQLGLDSLYCLTALPLTIAAVTLSWVGLSVGVATLIVWIGLPILFLTVLLSSWVAQAERWRLRAWLGRPAAGPGYLRPAPGASWFSRLLLSLRDPQKWLDVLWCAVAIVPGLIAFSVVAWLWIDVVGGLTYVFWRSATDFDATTASELARHFELTDDGGAELGLNVGLGLVALVVLPWAARAAAWGHGAFSDLVLNSRADLSDRVRRADGARAAAQQAEAASLRRLERDIHDGPQQRLVRLTMDLGRARRQIATDPELAATTVDDALRQARETLEELRALSRGIAPPLLVDRGLGVALDELAVRSAVPVELLHELPPGLSAHVETAVYFTVSEALTNVAKHSGAEAAVVRVVTDGPALVVEVLDRGVGGAQLREGHGLAGLEQRVAAVDGTLAVVSPAGGPTVLTARIPLP